MYTYQMSVVLKLLNIYIYTIIYTVYLHIYIVYQPKDQCGLVSCNFCNFLMWFLMAYESGSYLLQYVNVIEDTLPHDWAHLCPISCLMSVELFCPLILWRGLSCWNVIKLLKYFLHRGCESTAYLLSHPDL